MTLQSYIEALGSWYSHDSGRPSVSDGSCRTWTTVFTWGTLNKGKPYFELIVLYLHDLKENSNVWFCIHTEGESGPNPILIYTATSFIPLLHALPNYIQNRFRSEFTVFLTEHAHISATSLFITIQPGSFEQNQIWWIALTVTSRQEIAALIRYITGLYIYIYERQRERDKRRMSNGQKPP